MVDNLFSKCTAYCRYTGATPVNMTTVEVGIFSGWKADTTLLKTVE